MKLYVIQLEPYDDVVSVRDRLSFVRADRVLLVWPNAGAANRSNPSSTAILRRKLDLVLIQRAATHAGTRLGLVTRDPDVLDNADDLNISVFESIDAGSTIRWKRPLSAVFVDRSTRPAEPLDRYELMDAASRLRAVPTAQRRKSRIVQIVTAIVLAATLLSGVYIVAPAASVRVYPARDQLTATVQLVADPTIAIENVDSGHVPAILETNLIIERQATLPASGSADISASSASGTVIFTNNTGQPLAIPAGTIVKTLNGAHPARFHTMADALIDARGTTQVNIEALADSAGPDGNIEPNLITTIEGDLASSLSVRNATATSGGTVREQKIVTQNDRTKVLALARDQLTSNALADIKLTPTQFIAPGSIQILEERPEWTTFSAFVGDHTDTLTLTLRARIQALLIDELPARKVAYANLARQLQNRQIVVDSVSYQRGRVGVVDKNGQVAFLLTASADAVSSIDPQQVRDRITGVSVPDALARLQRDYLLDPRHPPQIDLLLPFLNRLPVLPIRIDVTVVQ